MDCDDLLKQLNEYIDGSAQAGGCDEFRAHLKDCATCQVVVDNIRNTIRLYKDGVEVEMSASCREKLHGLLKARFEAKYPSRS